MPIHCFRKKKIYIFFLLVSGLCGIFAACGASPQAVSDLGERKDYSYFFEFRGIPDPDEALKESGFLEGHEDCQVMERARSYQDTRIYRYLALADEEDGYFEICLQIFSEDNWAWETLHIPAAGWVEGRGGSVGFILSREAQELCVADGTCYMMPVRLDVMEMLVRREQARPYNFYALELFDIFAEELEPYFLGARSLEKTVEILDSRVQVYLNEKS